MTPVFIAALILGWIGVSFVVCVSVCMTSARFSARLEQPPHGAESTPQRPAPARRRRRPIEVRMEGGASTFKVKVS